MQLLDNCLLALSVQEEMSKVYAVVWMPTMKPYFANAKYVRSVLNQGDTKRLIM